MRHNRRISLQRRLLRLLENVEIVLQRRHRDKEVGDSELYGSVSVLPGGRYRVTLAVGACLQDGGLPIVLKTLMHELIHINDWDLSESEVERTVEELWQKRSYKLKSGLAEAVLDVALKKLFK